MQTLETPINFDNNRIGGGDVTRNRQSFVKFSDHDKVLMVQGDNKKCHRVSGHRFRAKLLHQPTFCSHCDQFIFGFGKQSYKCLGK